MNWDCMKKWKEPSFQKGIMSHICILPVSGCLFLPRNTLVVHNFSKDIQDEFKLLNPKVRIPSVAPLWDFPFMQECPVDAWLVFDAVLVVCGLTTAANASSSLRPLSISWRRIWPFDCLGKKIF